MLKETLLGAEHPLYTSCGHFLSLYTAQTTTAPPIHSMNISVKSIEFQKNLDTNCYVFITGKPLMNEHCYLRLTEKLARLNACIGFG
jgi:hypothetical protein